jgi:hypothetical protein
MSAYTVSINVKPYILQWVVKQYGTPAIFPKKSYLNYLIGELIAKPPAGFVPRPVTDNLDVELPFYTGKDVRSYNFVSDTSKKILAEHLRRQFYFALFDEIDTRRHSLNTGFGSAIRMFMEKYDIDEIWFETLKKQEYRKRRRGKQ